MERKFDAKFIKDVEEILDILNNAIDLAVERYNNHLHNNGYTIIDDYWKYGDFDGIYHAENAVIVRWEEMLNCGEYKTGTFYIPFECLYDDTWEAAVKEKAESFLRSKGYPKVVSDDERKERELLRKLKKKYPDE